MGVGPVGGGDRGTRNKEKQNKTNNKRNCVFIHQSYVCLVYIDWYR